VGIARNQFSFYLEIFSIPGFLAEPLATLGYQVIIGKDLPEDLPEEFKFGDMKQLLDSRGITDVTAIDLFDERADLRYDLNFPVPSTEEGRYRTVCDLGTLEHVFDTRQCMENCMRMVKPGGHYLLCTPVIGWHRHGLQPRAHHRRLPAERVRHRVLEIQHIKRSGRRGTGVRSNWAARRARSLPSARHPQWLDLDRWTENVFARRVSGTTARQVGARLSALAVAGVGEPRSILDFACGAGRVMLRLWQQALRGVLVFTNHGPSVAEMERKGFLERMTADEHAQIIESYDETGFGFVPSFSRELPVFYREAAWLGQDAVACVVDGLTRLR
jgi:hypothetical protein